MATVQEKIALMHAKKSTSDWVAVRHALTSSMRRAN